MKRMLMMVLLFVIMLAGMSTVFPTNKPLATAAAGGVFGGRILTIVNCNNPVKKFITLSGGLFGGNFIYVPPARYLNGPPTHPGQFLLGVSPGPTTCSIGNTVVAGKKIFILFGSSK